MTTSQPDYKLFGHHSSRIYSRFCSCSSWWFPGPSLHTRKTLVLIPLSTYTGPTHTWGQVTLWEKCSLTSSASSIPYIHSSWHLVADYVTNDVTLLVHPCIFMDDNTKKRVELPMVVWEAHTYMYVHTHTHTHTHTTDWSSRVSTMKCGQSFCASSLQGPQPSLTP